MNTFTKEHLLEQGKDRHCLTVGELKKFLAEHDMSDDAPVLIQRVEDKYYEGLDISGMRGPNGIIPTGSKASGWKVYPKVQGFVNDTYQTQYTPAWCCVYYKEDKEILFIDLHY